MHIENKGKLIELTNERAKKLRSTTKTVETALNYYEYCQYDLDAMTFSSYCDFLKEKGVMYTDAIFCRRFLRYILTDQMGVDKKEWPGRNTSETILENISIKQEAALFVTKDDWNYFSIKMEDVVKPTVQNRGLCKKYIIYAFVWNGIPASIFNNVRKEDLHVDGTIVSIFCNKKEYVIDDSCAAKMLNVILGYDNLQPFPLRQPKKFSKDHIEELKDRVGKVVEADLNTIYASGIIYRLSKGIEPDCIAKDNSYLRPYYKALSDYMYNKGDDKV